MYHHGTNSKKKSDDFASLLKQLSTKQNGRSLYLKGLGSVMQLRLIGLKIQKTRCS